MLRKLLVALFVVGGLSVAASAQEVEVDRYNINARIDVAASAVDVRASLAMSNLSQAPKPKLYFRLAKLAKVTSASVNGSSAQIDVTDDRRVTTLSQVAVTPSSSIPGGASFTVEMSYRIEAPESTPLVHIYPGEVLLAPESVWFPMPSTMYSAYGANTAPFTLTVSGSSPASGFRAMSSGQSKGDASNQVFEQPLNSLPLLVAGSYDQVIGSDQGGVRVEIAVQPGIVSPVPQKAGTPAISARIADECGKMIDFMTRTLGPPPAGATFRVISSVRASNIVVPGALALNEQVFRRDVLGVSTIEVLADAIARLWLDGRVRLRGQDPRSAAEGRAAQKARSAALLRDSLPRYLAALYIEDRFGRGAGFDSFARMRWAYAPVAQSGRDADLGIQNITLPNYTLAVSAKGPLVLRLFAETLGREKFISIIKTLFTGAQAKTVTIDDLRAALQKSSGEADKLFGQWVDSIIEPDIIVGAPLPSDKPGVVRINLRNLGTGDVTVPVIATTASGKQLTASVAVPSENITTIEIATSEKITAIEVDPAKLLIQSNYDNDARDNDATALRTSPQTLFNSSIAAFNKGQYAEAETQLREAARRAPSNSLVHAWLARALAAQKKSDEAASEAATAIKGDPPVGSALAWAHLTLGQVALSRNQVADGIRELKLATLNAEEAPAQFAARESLYQAQHGAGAQADPVDESVRAFISQLDAAIKQPTSDKLFTLAIRNNLKRFVQGITVSPPSAWATEIQRADPIDANRVALDVALKVRADNKDQSGTAVFILTRIGGKWLLEDVQLFNVK